jgi:hypothetical protein
VLDDLSVRSVINVREIQEPSAFEVEMEIIKLNIHKSPSIVQIHVYIFITSDRTINSTINKLFYILFRIGRNCRGVGGVYHFTYLQEK